MELLKEYQNLINKELRHIFNSLNKQVKSGQIPKVLYNAMTYSIFNGGKRIRPILCLATYDTIKSASRIGSSRRMVDSTGEQTYNEILPFACGIELIHTFSLIQDDLPSMDNDDFRRGKPSLHRSFDEGIAILSADALFAMAFELFAEAPVNDKKKIAAITELAKICGIDGLVSGQVLDIADKSQIRIRRTNIKSQKYIDAKKTAALIAGSMKIGAIIAGAKNKAIKKIEKAGTYLGLLFQTTDDILDKPALGGQISKAKLYAKQSKANFQDLGKEYNWFVNFTDYTLERKQ
jgi:geranylgeranyl diphosphate synthase type II